MLQTVETKEHCNMLAVYSLLHKAGRAHFSGILEEIGNKN